MPNESSVTQRIWLSNKIRSHFKRPLYPAKSSASEWTTFHLFFGWSKSLFPRFETLESQSYEHFRSIWLILYEISNRLLCRIHGFQRIYPFSICSETIINNIRKGYNICPTSNIISLILAFEINFQWWCMTYYSL